MNFHGIIVYEIKDNGRILKGLYTNTILDNRQNVMSEIVKNRSTESDEIEGLYSCCFIENGDTTHSGELEILRKNEVYKFLWKVKDHDKSLVEAFKGVGLKVGNNHLAVSYWRL